LIKYYIAPGLNLRNPVQQALIQSFCQNHSEAIECLCEAATTHPEPSVFVLLGKIQMKAEKTEVRNIVLLGIDFPIQLISKLTVLCYIELACDAFSMAIRLHSSYPEAFYQRGLCRMQLRQTKCIQDFNHTLVLCPSHFQAYMGRAAYYGSKGRYSKAIMNCNEAIKIHPNSVKAYFYRGILKYQNKTFKAAIEDLSKTIDLDNTCILAYYNRAVCYHQIKNFRKVQYTILQHHRITLLNEFEEAVRSFNQVLRLEPISVEAYVGRGNSYMKNGCEAALEQAQKDFLKAIHLNPMCMKARICLGYNLQALGKLQSAWNQLTVVIAIDSKCDTAYEGRASVSLQMGEIFSALQDINTALKLTTTAPLLTNRGVINQLMGYLSSAMKDYQQAISVDPNYALAYFSAANIYFHNHQFSQVSLQKIYTVSMLSSENFFLFDFINKYCRHEDVF
uniref:Tetratricopeptide repeat domain 6 n=1 Tax=Pavo cristatus TaxID=9049 RepID=A0A8C9G4H1_PAVCR